MIQRLLIILLLVTTSIQAKENISGLVFNNIGVNDGLSQMSVTSIEQDEANRLWIGTRDGLDLYDGNRVKVYRSIRGDSTSLLGNEVIDLKVIGEKVWTVTREGVSCLDVRSQKFRRLHIVGVKSILPIKDNLYLGTEKGLYKLHIPSWTMSDIDKNIGADFYVRDLYQDVAGFVWICTNKGLYKRNITLGREVRFTDEDVNTVFIDSNKLIWVGTQNRGVYLYAKHGDLLHNFSTENQNYTLSHNMVRDIQEDDDGHVWIGTFLGLSVINTHDFNIHIYRQNQELGSLSNNSIYALHKDNHGTMWLGSYFGGLSYANQSSEGYVYYQLAENEGESISYPVIGDIIEDENGNLWIATEGGGVNYYDRQKQTFKVYMGSKELNAFNNVKCVYKASSDILYFGSHLGGLTKLEISSGKFTRFLHDDDDDNSLSNNVVNVIIPFNDKFLLGTHNGLVLFSPKDNVFEPFITDEDHNTNIGKIIRTLFEDSFGKIWIGTEKQGLFAYDVADGSLESYFYKEEDYSSISNNTVVSIYEDHQFRLWFGTAGGGLCLYNREADNFENYNTANNALASDFICGIAESRFGNLWVTTTRGITWFDTSKNKGISIKSNEGFPLTELNYGALLLTRDGHLFVGGIDGLVSFEEENLFNDLNDVHLNFSSLEVNNVEIYPNDNTGILSEDINVSESFKLYPKHKNFELFFSDCSYQGNFRLTVRYRLSDDDMWVDVERRRSISFANLAPGRYDFTLQVLNNIDTKVLDERRIFITIVPPIYNRWYAYVLYIVIIFLILLWRNNSYLNRVRLMDTLKDEQREKQQMQDLNNSKLRFFTNISHEFRTPLTLIVGTVELILDEMKTVSKHYGNLKIIESNAKRLNFLIGELLDFRRMEQGQLHLHVEECKTDEFLKTIHDSFQAYAMNKRIEFTIKASSSVLWMDKVQMEKVMYNLLSNAFKVVPTDNGSIAIEMIEQVNSIDINVTNNGPLLSDDQAQHIFDRFYYIDQLGLGNSSGIGLAFTKAIMEEHHGHINVVSSEKTNTIFTVSLLKGNKHYSDAQLEKVSRSNQVNDGALQLPLGDDSQEETMHDNDNRTKVLLVEDNDEVRHMVRTALSKIYNVIEAVNGRDGLDKAIEVQPDLIVSDVMMPIMSGTEMCKKLRRNDNTSHIPIILLTARTAVEHKIEGAESGADEYITKPFSIRLLKANVKNLIARKETLQEVYKSNPESSEREVAVNTIDTELLEKARQIVESHLDDETFDIVAFAKEMGVGRTRLFSKIKGVTGQTPNEFVLSVRLKKAAHILLHDSNVNISEVAYMVGFSTPRYFSLCFKDHFGITPSAYIKQTANK